MRIDNPFSTKHWTPGILSYRFHDGEELEVLAQRFLQLGGVAQIVGPHGTGKTTLLESLARHFRQQGFQIGRATLHEGQRRLPKDFWPESSPAAQPQTLCLLDGYEQLSFPDRWSLRLRNWRKKGLLLWTTHHPVPFVPLLHQTHSHFSLFQELVNRLTEHTSISFDNNELKRIFDGANGNFRNAFFALYDRVEDSTIPRIHHEPHKIP